MAVMSTMILGYTAVMWSIIILLPNALIGIFSSDAALMQDAVPALKQYFAAFICMDFQYIGQTVFKSLNKRNRQFFLTASQGLYCCTTHVYDAVYVSHGNGRSVPCRASIKYNWWNTLPCCDAVHRSSRAKENGEAKFEKCVTIKKRKDMPLNDKRVI